MPVVRSAEEQQRTQFEGWAETTCASPSTFGEPVPVNVRRVVVDPGAMASVGATAEEVMVYVVRGTGELIAADERHRLDPESMAWIDPSGPFSLEAADGGLEVLVTEAP